MARLNRFLQRIFGSTAQSQELGRFGSLANGTVQYATNPDQVQELDRYLRGWFGGVVGNNSPAIQDVNGLFYMLTYQLAYLMQRGIPEWNSETTYYIGSICSTPAGVAYRSLTDNNQNVAVTDTTNWEEAFSATNPADGLTQAQINEFLTDFQISGSTITVTNQGGDTTTFMLAGGTGTASPADGLTQGEVNALLSGASLTDSTITFTRQNGDTFTIDIPTPDASPADGLTQAEVNNFLNAVSLSSGVLTFTSQDGSTTAITLPTPTASPADGLTQAEVNALLNDADLSGTTLTFTRQNGDTVALTIPSGTTSAADGLTESEVDNLVNNLTLSGTTLTVTRQGGSTFTITLPSSGGTTTSPADGLTETEVNNLIKGLTLSNSVLTITRQNDATSTITLPSPTTSPADGLTQTEVNALLADADLSGTTLTFTRQNGDVVTIEIPSGTTSPADGLSQNEVDNLINNLSLSNSTLTVTRQDGDTFTITLPSGGTGTTSPADGLTQGEINNLLNSISLSGSTLTIGRQGANDIVISNVGGTFVLDTAWGDEAAESARTTEAPSRNIADSRFRQIEGKPIASLADASQNTILLGQPTFANNVLSFPVVDGGTLEINIGSVEIDLSGTTVTPELTDRLLIGDRSLVDNVGGLTRPDSQPDDLSGTLWAGSGAFSLVYAEDASNNRYLFGGNQRRIYYNFSTSSFGTGLNSGSYTAYAWNPGTEYVYFVRNNFLQRRAVPDGAPNSIESGVDVSAPSFVTDISPTASVIKDGIWYFLGADSSTSVVRALRISDRTRQETLEPDISSIPNAVGIAISSSHFYFTSSDNSNLYTVQTNDLTGFSTFSGILDRSYLDITIDNEGNLWGAWNDTAGNAFKLDKYDAAAQIPVFSNAPISIEDLLDLAPGESPADAMTQPEVNAILNDVAVVEGENTLRFERQDGTTHDVDLPDQTTEIFNTNEDDTPVSEDKLLFGQAEEVPQTTGPFSRNDVDDVTTNPSDSRLIGVAASNYNGQNILWAVDSFRDNVRAINPETSTEIAVHVFSRSSIPGTQSFNTSAVSSGIAATDTHIYLLGTDFANYVPVKISDKTIDTSLPIINRLAPVSSPSTQCEIDNNILYTFARVNNQSTIVLFDINTGSQLTDSSITIPAGFTGNFNGIAVSIDQVFVLETRSGVNYVHSFDKSTGNLNGTEYQNQLTAATGNFQGMTFGFGNLFVNNGGGGDSILALAPSATRTEYNNKLVTLNNFRDQIAPPLPILNSVESGATFPATHSANNGDTLTVGNFARMEEDRKLISVDASIYPNANTDTFSFVVGEVVRGTFNSVEGDQLLSTATYVSESISLSGQTITSGNRHRVTFSFSDPAPLVRGKTYFFGISRTDVDDTTNTDQDIDIPLGTLNITDGAITPIFQRGFISNNLNLNDEIIGNLEGAFSRDVVLQSSQSTYLTFETLNFINENSSSNRRELLPSQTTIRNNTDITLNDSILNYAEITVFIRIAHASDTGKWIMLPSFSFRPSLLSQGTRQLQLKVGNEAVGNNNRHFWLELDEDNPTVITMITTPTTYDGDALIMSIEGRK